MLIDHDPLNIIITGVGGQGNVLASQILGRMLQEAGKTVTIGETLGLSQRGGAVMSHVRAAADSSLAPIIPQGRADLILALEPVEGLRMLAPFGRPETVMIVNTRPVHPIDVAAGLAEYPDLETVLGRLSGLTGSLYTLAATEIALELGNPILANIALMGAMEGVLGLDRSVFETAAGQLLPASKMAANLTAYDRGRDESRPYK